MAIFENFNSKIVYNNSFKIILEVRKKAENDFYNNLKLIDRGSGEPVEGAGRPHPSQLSWPAPWDLGTPEQLRGIRSSVLLCKSEEYLLVWGKDTGATLEEQGEQGKQENEEEHSLVNPSCSFSPRNAFNRMLMVKCKQVTRCREVYVINFYSKRAGARFLLPPIGQQA